VTNSGKISYLTKELKQRIDWLHSKAKILLKQRFDFPFDKRVETMDRLLTMQGQKIAQTTVRFPFQKRIETTDRFLTIQGPKIVKKTVKFPI